MSRVVHVELERPVLEAAPAWSPRGECWSYPEPDGTNQAGKVAGREVEVDPVEHRLATVTDRQPAYP